MQPRRAFTLVEVLVAVVLMGVGSAALVTALTGDHRLRERAAESRFAAASARARIELLASLPCSADASGVTASAWGSERWSARVSASRWNLTDSVVPRPPAAPIVIEARVACPG
ncbi:MAG TPA: prepilin-type N-terminal cleavage/methylation domain-containing protein [Gemmatimonadaceae bacterium]